MFELFKKLFVRLLTGLVNRYNHTTYVSLSNGKCKIQPALLIYIPINTFKNFTIITDSGVICNEIIDTDTKLSPKDDEEQTKTFSKNFNKKKATLKMQTFYILFAFLLSTITLIAISIYCYLIKYRSKHLLTFPYTNN